jgi:hypothetical protein
MRLDDLVEVESHADLDVPCASWGLTDPFLKWVRMKNCQFSAIRGEADRIRDKPMGAKFSNHEVQISSVRR